MNFINISNTVFKTFITGSYFGEIEIIRGSKTRKYTTIAEELLELFLLDKMVYINIVEVEFPEIHNEIKVISKIRSKRMKIDEENFKYDYETKKEEININKIMTIAEVDNEENNSNDSMSVRSNFSDEFNRNRKRQMLLKDSCRSLNKKETDNINNANNYGNKNLNVKSRFTNENIVQDNDGISPNKNLKRNSFIVKNNTVSLINNLEKDKTQDLDAIIRKQKQRNTIVANSVFNFLLKDLKNKELNKNDTLDYNKNNDIKDQVSKTIFNFSKSDLPEKIESKKFLNENLPIPDKQDINEKEKSVEIIYNQDDSLDSNSKDSDYLNDEEENRLKTKISNNKQAFKNLSNNFKNEDNEKNENDNNIKIEEKSSDNEITDKVNFNRKRKDEIYKEKDESEKIIDDLTTISKNQSQLIQKISKFMNKDNKNT